VIRVGYRLGTRAAIAVGFVVFLVFAGTGLASAAWFVSASSSGTVSAATVSFTAVGTGSLTTEYKFAGAAPGGATVRSVVLTNTGQSPLNYSLTVANTGSATLPANVSLTLWLMSGSCGTTPGTGNTAGTVAAPPAMPAGVTSAAVGASAVTLCMMTRLTTTVALAQGQSVTSTPTFTGTVGTSTWKASVLDAAFTQTVYRVANVTGATCTTTPPALLNGYATLNWTTVAGVTYKLVDSGNGGSINPSTPPQRLDAIQLSGSPSGTTTIVTIYAMESTYGTTSSGVSFQLTSQLGVIGVLLASVTCPP